MPGSRISRSARCDWQVAWTGRIKVCVAWGSTMPGSLEAGAASSDITPAASLPLAGYGGREGCSDGVHNPIGVRALVLDDGAQTVGIANVDLLNASRPLVAAIEQILASRDIDFDMLTIAATHTHAAPYIPTPALEIHPTLPREYDAAAYVESVAEACADALVAAQDALAPADIRVGLAENADVAENRRANPGWGARIPRGTIDPTLTALSIRPKDAGEIVVYNYALHPVCTTPDENHISSDWPGYAAERIREHRDSIEEVLFLNGAAGDVNPCQKTTVQRTGEEVYEYMAEIGHDVGDTVHAALQDADSTDAFSSTPLHVRSRDIQLRVKNPGTPATIRDRLAEIESCIPEAGTDGEGAPDHLVRERRYLVEQLAIAEWDATHLTATLTYLEFGSIGILTVPAEILVGHGFRWKEAATVDFLLPVTYADDYIGYIPELEDLENGGYEVETCKVHPEAISRLCEVGVDLVSESASGPLYG